MQEKLEMVLGTHKIVDVTYRYNDFGRTFCLLHQPANGTVTVGESGILQVKLELVPHRRDSDFAKAVGLLPDYMNIVEGQGMDEPISFLASYENDRKNRITMFMPGTDFKIEEDVITLAKQIEPGNWEYYRHEGQPDRKFAFSYKGKEIGRVAEDIRKRLYNTDDLGIPYYKFHTL